MIDFLTIESEIAAMKSSFPVYALVWKSIQAPCAQSAFPGISELARPRWRIKINMIFRQDMRQLPIGYREYLPAT